MFNCMPVLTFGSPCIFICCIKHLNKFPIILMGEFSSLLFLLNLYPVQCCLSCKIPTTDIKTYCTNKGGAEPADLN